MDAAREETPGGEPPGGAGPDGGECTPLVALDRVSKTYREGPVQTKVLRGASLRLAPGEITSLTGASGSGKSTLISLLAGLLRPDSGRVVFDGEDVGSLDDAARARLRSGRIGVVMQSGNLIPFLTAAENIELAIGLAGGERAEERARELLAVLGLAGRKDHFPRRMSGGEAQRVSVAMALANQPDLLLADEVTGELDSSSAEQVMEVIFGAGRQQGLTVLFVTHNDDLAARAHRRLRLDDGEVHRL